jgi:hypothetical protein
MHKLLLRLQLLLLLLPPCHAVCAAHHIAATAVLLACSLGIAAVFIHHSNEN